MNAAGSAAQRGRRSLEILFLINALSLS